ncbi:GNAT family N-acetyltransferase [Metabacillus arenae]|uniref:GNAT family N-acetyltransferase n=1 Tax=Metabacillus arenae TaxID=2771434 RepID=A0A926NMP6_9BACI|nr:GNAT family N-acetyltransferase [Metabacillus arenae]MBD1383535.1 GNAT family N-acetyltransferase [Metabacillus arenae]
MIRQAAEQDLKRINEMVMKTVAIMKSEGNDQWDETYPKMDQFRTDLRNGTLYVKQENDDVIGSITMDQNFPKEYDGIQWTSKFALSFTFHRLVVDPEARKSGMASELIEFTEKEAASKGARFMKIDTYSLNEKAQKLLVRNGYVKVGEMSFHGKENHFYCYEKRISDTFI